MTDSDTAATPLLGAWIKVTESSCAEKYPTTVTFSTGTYRGSRGPGQGMIWWDAGMYRLEGPHTLLLSVATDELVTYRFEMGEEMFHVTDPDGCRFSYQRAPRA